MKRIFLAALLPLLLPANALATTALRLLPSELAAKASLVAEGEVLSVTHERSADGKRIFRRVLLRVEENWKGEAAEVEIAVPGGTVGEFTQLVQGMPAFREGEKVVVFLEKPSPSPLYRVVGLSQGKFSVAELPQEGRYLLPSLEGLKLVDPLTGEEASPFIETPIPLEDFRRRILAPETR